MTKKDTSTNNNDVNGNLPMMDDDEKHEEDEEVFTIAVIKNDLEGGNRGNVKKQFCLKIDEFVVNKVF